MLKVIGLWIWDGVKITSHIVHNTWLASCYVVLIIETPEVLSI